MRERPILFSAPMVRAILAGAKTVTRRAVKECHIDAAPPASFFQWLRERCPYGLPGDRLWVREAFIHEPADFCWEASVSIPCRPASTVYRADHEGDTRGAGWKPSIYMPRNLSRITLEVTGVRVERLQDISEKDAQAEGIERTEDFFGCPCWRVYGEPDGEEVVAPDDPIGSYRSLWESINGPGSWEANPWVWAVSFRRLDAKEGTP